MASRWMLRVVLGAWLCTSAGCDVFDDELEMRLEDAGGGDGDGDGDGDQDAGEPPFALADSCLGEMPEVMGPAKSLLIPVMGLRSNISVPETCPIEGDVVSRADGFFKIKATAGQRWHFHLDAAEGQDLAIVAMPNCDIRSCDAVANLCGTKGPEHFTFVPTIGGEYIIMIDGIDPAQAADLTLLAVSPVCGNGGKPEHSEACEDGNINSGDGCDNVCRKELHKQIDEEGEPNDDSFGANVLLPPTFSDDFVVAGNIAGPACAPDYFLLRIDSKQVFTATVLNEAGDPCMHRTGVPDAPTLELQVRKAVDDQRDAPAALASATSPKAGECPTLQKELAPGTYFIRLESATQPEKFLYQLSMKLEPPPPPP